MPDGIDTFASQPQQIDIDIIYTLSGIRVSGSALRPGIYIKNGKKVIVR